MQLADVAFAPAPPSRRWLLVLSLLLHAMALAVVMVGTRWQIERAGPERHATVDCTLTPPRAPGMICRAWAADGDLVYCKRYYEIPREIVQFDCARLSPELLRALRQWPYRVHPCPAAAAPAHDAAVGSN